LMNKWLEALEALETMSESRIAGRIEWYGLVKEVQTFYRIRHQKILIH